MLQQMISLLRIYVTNDQSLEDMLQMIGLLRIYVTNDQTIVSLMCTLYRPNVYRHYVHMPMCLYSPMCTGTGARVQCVQAQVAQAQCAQAQCAQAQCVQAKCAQTKYQQALCV